MGKTPAATADTEVTPVLEPFEGNDVRQVGIEIPGAAGGLRDAMKIDPQVFRQGERCYVVLECEVAKVRFEPIDASDKAGDQRRVHVFDVQAATMVDEGVVRRHLDEQAAKIAAMKERAAGTRSLADSDEEDEESAAHRRQHFAGVHADGLRRGCPLCENEAAAMRDEGTEPVFLGDPDEPGE